MRTLHHFVGGSWEESADAACRELVNPANELVVARFPVGSPEAVDRAVTAATRAQPAWKALPLAERVRRIGAWADRVADHADELAELECQEMGRPVALGRSFVAAAAAELRAASAAAQAYAFESVVARADDGTSRIVRHPVGVAAVITPWNFPVATVLTALGPLLAAGNTVVVKPSEKSPLSAVRLFELLTLPPGVANLVLGDARAGAPLSEHPDVALVHFTGSVEAGRQVAIAAGRRLRRSILELGGKDPVIVDAGVDPVATAAAVATGSFLNSGQICTSMERIYVHRDVATAFVDALVDAAAAQTLGDGHHPSTVLGPLVDAQQRDIVHAQVQDAVARGAKVRIGGEVPIGAGFFYPATVLTGVDDSMTIMNEETFGPVAPVQVVASFDEALTLASRSRFGLAATVYTDDPGHASAAEAIPAGITWINRWQGGGPERVYEPARDSGTGATGAHAAYDAATRPSTIHIAPPPRSG
ncbi:MAG TPA: aldehyde dehydrogenase family protein [Yinghuangia sp.]|nr:aldehyde dehydrogenase family protein [Yinghuangia sp.]